MNTSRVARWLAPLLVALLAVLAFAPALANGLVDFDDEFLLVRNEHYHGLGLNELGWMFSTRLMGHWQPLTWISFGFDWIVAHGDPAQFHRTSIVIHAANAALCVLLARRLLALARPHAAREHPLRLEFAAGVSALVFAVHPLRVESVAWATERRDVLSTCFLLLAALAYLASVRPGESALVSRKAWIVSILALVLSLLSKAWGMSFVCVTIVLDVYPLRRLAPDPRTWFANDKRAVWWPKLPYLVLGLGAAAMANWSIHAAQGTVKSFEEWSLVSRCAQAASGLLFYVQKTLWPTGLAALYEIPRDFDPLAPARIADFIALALGTLLIIWQRRRLPALAAAGALYVLVVAPVLGFVQSGPQFVADRYSYVSCLGWAMCAGAGAWLAWERSSAAWMRGAFALFLLALFAVSFQLTRAQTRTWHDKESLWTNVLAVQPECSIAHRNLALVLLERGEIESGLQHLHEALRSDPHNADAWFTQARVEEQRKDWSAAAEAWREAARWSVPAWPQWMGLGRVQRDGLGQLDQAILSFRAAVEDLEHGPRATFSPRPHLVLGQALAARGSKDEARKELEIALRYALTAAEAQESLRELDPRH